MSASSPRRRPTWAGPVVLGLALLASWEVGVRVSGTSDLILPAPSDIGLALYQNVRSGIMGRHFAITASATLLGFGLGVVLALAAGIPIAMSTTVERYLYPYILALQTTPKVAIAPLLMIWVGVGLSSKVIIAAVVVLFPVLINLVVGSRAAQRSHMELLDVYGGDWIDEIRYVRLPTALPFIFAGLKTGSVLGLLGAVTGEFVGATGGLGYLLTQQMNRLDTPGVFSVLLVLMLFGLSIYLVMDWLERITIFWRDSAERTRLRQL